MRQERKRGFTLVELSIVLVIVGLLIGGILVAQSMRKTATIQAQIKQIQQLDAGINNFITRYNGLPGDSSLFGCVQDPRGPGYNLCDDGIIVGDSTSVSHFRFSGETTNVWPALQNGLGLFQGTTFSNNNDCSSLINCEIPAAIAKNVGIMVAYETLLYGVNYNSYGFADYSPGKTGFRSTAPIIPCDMILAIDTKLDDGIETAGNVRGGLPLNAAGGLITVKLDCNGYTSLNLNGSMLVKILSQAGG